MMEMKKEKMEMMKEKMEEMMKSACKCNDEKESYHCNTPNQPMPRIGDTAPAFEAKTTQGHLSFPADCAGKWVILFSHPADFTPVCTSEFISFARDADFYTTHNCQLIGISIDSLHSHIAWLQTIYKKVEYKGLKDIKVEFPLVDDVSMNISKSYGMLQPNESQTAAVRAVFFIDPMGIIRAIIYYPMVLGRNFEEIKRVLIALQTADQFKVALPADWKLGEEVVIPAPSTLNEAIERTEHLKEGTVCHDWFFCTRPLPKEEVIAALHK